MFIYEILKQEKTAWVKPSAFISRGEREIWCSLFSEARPSADDVFNCSVSYASRPGFIAEIPDTSYIDDMRQTLNYDLVGYYLNLHPNSLLMVIKQ